MPNPVVRFFIASHRPTELAAFYGRALGWRAQHAQGFVLVDTGPGGLPGVIGPGAAGYGAYIALYTEVDHPAAALQQIAGSGGRVVAPATAHPALGLAGTYADPEGHVMGLVQSQPDYSHHEYRVYAWPPEPGEGAVVHFEITGRDPAALRTFYRNVFGWHADTSHGPGYAPVDTHTVCISGAIGLQDRDTCPVTVYAQTADVAGTLARVEAAGGRGMAAHPPAYALFADPEGHVLGLLAPDA